MENKVGKLESMEAKIEYLTNMKCVHSQELEIIKKNQDVFNDKLEVLKNGFNNLGSVLNEITKKMDKITIHLENILEDQDEEEEECEEEDCPACKESSTKWEAEALDKLAQKAREFKDLLKSMTEKK